MKPIYPFFILEEDLKNGSWVSKPELATNILHIRNVCAGFPSLLLGYSADEDAKLYSDLIVSVITQQWGVNVFLQDDAVPLPALSYAITTRSMPIGIYIEKENHLGRPVAKLTLISTHGGLFNEADLKAEPVAKPSKQGVVGTADILSSYVKQLTGFVDPYIDEGISFSEFLIPFKSLSNKLKAREGLEVLNQRQTKGPIGILTNNGCYVNLYRNNELLTTEKLALQLSQYLKDERFASGTLLAPEGKSGAFGQFGEVTEVEESESNLSCMASFSDLFLGWWPEKLIALQGSSCFGDGLLVAIYYIESLRSKAQS